MAINYFGLTDKGLVRANNEDAFISTSSMNDRFVIGCVIDGVGGYEGGEVAAKIAYDSIVSTVKEIPLDNLSDYLKEALLTVNNTIYHEKQSSLANSSMACVLTLVVVDNEKNKFYYAHVGDTRLYLFRDGSLNKITNDHSFVGFLEDKRKISEEEAMRHPKRNEINKALGFDIDISPDNYIDTGDSPFLPSDILLICSDGLTDMVDNRKMVTILAQEIALPQMANQLIAAANEAGGFDNVTVVLVKNENASLHHEATKPIKSITEKKAPEAQSLSSVNEKAKKEMNKSRFPFLLLLAIVFLIGIGYIIFLYMQRYNSQEEKNNFMTNRRNEVEQTLIDSINDSKLTEVIIQSKEGNRTILLNDSVFIKRDSLLLIGNGTIIKCDTSYKGTAISLSTTCKYILLDSVTLENFDIGIIARSPVLYLRHVHFVNCKIPVQYNFDYNNTSIINNKIADSVFYNAEIKSDHP